MSTQFDMPAEQYHSTPALSYSGMKDLAVSPLRYWYLHVNPNRPKDEPTKYMDFGSAVHCAVLEPDKFDERYVCAIDPADFEGCLRTMDDLRGWLKRRVIEPKGKLKEDLIRQVQSVDPNWPILDILEAEHAERNKGKTELKKADWFRVGAAANALRSEPEMAAILQEGRAEVSYFVTHPETGVKLKARMDWVTKRRIADVKTFSVPRGKSTDQAVIDAIWYERYGGKAWFYTHVRYLAEGWVSEEPFVFPFVESDPPHETRLISLGPRCDDEASLLWEQSRAECASLIRLYADCWERFGERPWRYEQEVRPLLDQDIKQLAY